MPAVTICEVYNGEKSWDLNEQYLFFHYDLIGDSYQKSSRYFGSERDKRFDDFISTISFFTGHCFPCKYCGVSLKCPSNYTDILNKVIYLHTEYTSKD